MSLEDLDRVLSDVRKEVLSWPHHVVCVKCGKKVERVLSSCRNGEEADDHSIAVSFNVPSGALKDWVFRTGETDRPGHYCPVCRFLTPL